MTSVSPTATTAMVTVPMKAIEWIVGIDTGLSSKQIWSFMLGVGAGDYPPADAGDFGRCFRLLRLIPEWRARIGEMAQVGPRWAAVAAHWSDLEELYGATDADAMRTLLRRMDFAHDLSRSMFRTERTAMTKQKTAMVRQGDVLLLLIKAAKKDLEDVPSDPRGLVVAEGETSGHFHAIYGSGAKLARFKTAPGRIVALVDGGGEIRVVGGGAGGVDRHTPISLAPGRYEVRIQRAWTSALASRQVQD